MSQVYVCRFYLEGRCQYGAECTHPHPAGMEGIKPSTAATDNLDSNNSDLVNVSSQDPQAPEAPSASTSTPIQPSKHLYSSVTSSENQEVASFPPGMYSLTTQVILEYLQPKDSPLWRLSSYGPSNYEPNLINGLDMSQEELRYEAWLKTKEGRAEEIVSTTEPKEHTCLPSATSKPSKTPFISLLLQYE